MLRISPPAQSRSSDTHRSARRIALPVTLLASLLWHLLLVQWANGHFAIPAFRSETTTVITTELRPAPIVAKPVTPAPPKPKRKPKPRLAAPPPPPPESVTEAVAEIPAITEVPVADAAPAAEAAEPLPHIADAAPEADDTKGGFRFDPPPSAELKYDVQALRDGNRWYGTGVFQWDAADGSYVITGEASITFLLKITVLNFRSEGAINASGIAPVLYSEKPWRKAMTNTHFQHENRKISFSASQAVYPYNGGEQDRASIMWQLAGIGRGDPAQFTPGGAFDIMVAGARDADVWRIDVVGLEEIDTSHGKMTAWHVVRAPKPDSYEQKIDIWLAPQHEWYPAKVRFTYANGDYLDMLLAELTPRVAADSFSGHE